MEVKNNQQTKMGDTATVEQPDVSPYMVPEVVRKTVTVSKGGVKPETSGVKTPGNPSM